MSSSMVADMSQGVPHMNPNSRMWTSLPTHSYDPMSALAAAAGAHAHLNLNPYFGSFMPAPMASSPRVMPAMNPLSPRSLPTPTAAQVSSAWTPVIGVTTSTDDMPPSPGSKRQRTVSGARARAAGLTLPPQLQAFAPSSPTSTNSPPGSSSPTEREAGRKYRKNKREQQRRSQINTRFSELAKSVGLDAKTDKLTILEAAIDALAGHAPTHQGMVPYARPEGVPPTMTGTSLTASGVLL